MERASQNFLSDVRRLPAIRAFLRNTCCRAWGPGAEEEVAALELALDEAVANVILHAYQREPGRPIEIVVDVGLEQVCVQVFHEGRAFDPAQAAAPVFDGSRESGFGLYLMKQAVEEVTFFTDDGGRRGVRLVKKRRPAAPQEAT